MGLKALRPTAKYAFSATALFFQSPFKALEISLLLNATCFKEQEEDCFFFHYLTERSSFNHQYSSFLHI